MEDRLTKSEIAQILQKRFEGDVVTSLSKLPNPLSMPNAQKAAKRVKEAIEKNEKIVIVGDYDVDGIVSAAILEEFLEKSGASPSTIIPCRFKDGYGLGMGIIGRIEADLIITVDNGIAAIEAANECARRNIELIVIDHHTIGETLPNAYAIVHPKLGDGFCFKEICAAAVVWYFLAALKQELGSEENLKEYLDLVAIATIADVMPLRDINRTLVKAGIEVMKTSKRPAVRAISTKLCKTSFTASDIAYKISPRLNSAGRLTLAKEAFCFLRAKEYNEAAVFFERLDSLNEQRKKVESGVFEEALELSKGSEHIIVAAKEGWHEGVVGIVASKLAQTMGKPALVFSIENGIAKGSARSVGDFNIFEAISECSDLLASFGGHKMAAGVSLKSEYLPEFEKRLNEAAKKLCKGIDCPLKNGFGLIDLSQIDEELADILESFEPYGEGNERPIFTAKNKLVKEIKPIGKEKGFRLTLCDESNHEQKTVKAVCFRGNAKPKEGEYVNFRFSVYKNSFFGGSVELMVEEILLS